VKTSNLSELDTEIIKESQRWVRENKGLKIGSKGYNSPRVSSEIADCSMPMTFDHFSYCSLGCLYCFAYYFKSNNPAIKDRSLGSVNIDRMINSIRGRPHNQLERSFYNNFYKQKFLLHWGGLADPFCFFERANLVGYPLIQALGEENYPTLFSFKGDAVFMKQYRRLFTKYSSQRNFAFQVSIITGDEDMARKVEIGVPNVSKRLEAIKMLSEMGYWTILRLRPYIIGISEDCIDELLDRAYQAGINGVSMEFFALDVRATIGMKTRYDWLGKQTGAKDMMKYFSRLSPKERGGYLRLNRDVKEPHVKRVYKFCAERKLVFACSDPDFKELNTSGSCCGMPDSYPANRGLENWTRSQLTYHLKEARKKYHTTGELCLFKFREVFADETYLDDKLLANDHISVIEKCCAERMNLTQRLILQMQWNNLKSYANPRNYFHGKMMPIGTDNEGNLVFRYQPHEYEERWKREGINLKR